jgi:hypothetical protein
MGYVKPGLSVDHSGTAAAGSRMNRSTMGGMLFKLTTKNIPSNSHLYGVKQKSKREAKDSYT